MAKEKWRDVIKVYKFQLYKINSGDLMYRTVTVGENTELHTWNLPMGYILSFLTNTQTHTQTHAQMVMAIVWGYGYLIDLVVVIINIL